MSENPYSRDNIPTSIENAEKRFKDLEDQIEGINSDLESKNSDNFPSVDEYRSWRNRATSALSYKKKEKGFLGDWISKNRPKTTTIDNSLQVLKDLASARLRTLEYEREYFTIGDVPQISSEVEARRVILVDIKQSLSSIIPELEALSHEICKHKGNLIIAKRPVLKMIESVEKELSLVKQHRRAVALKQSADRTDILEVVGMSAKGTISFLYDLIEENGLRNEADANVKKILKKIGIFLQN